MNRQLTGSTALALFAASLILHPSGGGGGRVISMLGMGHHAADPKATKKSETASAVQQDAQACYPFEVLLRQAGTVEQPWLPDTPEAAHQKNGGFVCNAPALAQRVQPRPIKQKANRPPPPAPHLDNLFSGRVLIATVPDPLETSDSLEFDRSIAALQEAGSAAGYDFERIATPWELSDLQEPKDLKEGREDEYYRRVFGDEPGAILFHCKGWPSECSGAGSTVRQLLLLLVPESPVYGLNIHAANEALAAYHAIMAVNQNKHISSASIRWIGPEYSASAGDLKRLRGEPEKAADMPSFCVLSGSISGQQSVNLLKENNQLVNHCMPGRVPTLSALDSEALEQLVRHDAFSHGTVAVISEDETAYGGETAYSANSYIYDTQKPDQTRVYDQYYIDGKVPYRHFSFPRGISHVRGLYGRSMRDASAMAAQQDGSASTSSIMDFADTLQQPSDSAEEFAAQSPVSNESIIASIASSVAHIRAQTIVILATDPLDQIFLARYFHRSVPNSRLVLLSAERLLPRLRGDFDLDGTIIVSRFPLFQDSYLTLPPPLESRHSMSFASSSQEGFFLAALEQIVAAPIQQAPVDNQKNDMALWIAVAGGGDFWPVDYQQLVARPAPAASAATSNGSPDLALSPAAFAQQATKFPKSATVKQPSAKGNRSPVASADTERQVEELDPRTSNTAILLVDTPNEALPALWNLALQLTLLGSLIHLLLFLAARRKYRSFDSGSISDSASPALDRLRRNFSKIRRHRILSYYFLYADQHPDGSAAEMQGRVFYFGHCWWLMNLSVLFLTVLSYLLLPAIVYRGTITNQQATFWSDLWSFRRSIGWPGWLTLSLVVCQAGLLAYLGLRSIFLAWSHDYEHKRPRCAATLAPICSIAWLVICLWLYCRQLFEATSGWLFAIRCLHLNSGVCPILPLLLVSAGLLAIAVAYLNSLTLCSTRDPGFPRLGSWEYLWVKEWSRSLETYMGDWNALPVRLLLLLIAALGVCIVIFKPWEALATFDIGPVTILYSLVFLTCIYFALTLAIRFLKLWTVLRFGLESLEASPLRYAFSRLPRVFSPGPIWSYAGLRRQVILLWRSIEYLRVSPPDPSGAATSDNAVQALYPLAEKIKRSEQFEPAEFLTFNSVLNDYVPHLAALPLVRQAWDRGGPDIAGKPDKSDRCKYPDPRKPDGETKPIPVEAAHKDVPPPCGFDQSEPDSCAVSRANEFIASRFAFYIRYIVLHLKNLMTFMSVSMLFLVLAAVSYPFNRQVEVLWQVASILLLVLLIVATVLKQMDRDAILSRLSDTDPGKLNLGTYTLQLLSVGGLPVLTVLASVFPALGNFVFSFARPLLQSLH